jgi:hypothetical protein
MLPRFARQVKTAAFGKWLEQRGATLLHVTNPYEVLRYRQAGPAGALGLAYKNKRGIMTHWTPAAKVDYQRFLQEEKANARSRPRRDGANLSAVHDLCRARGEVA